MEIGKIVVCPLFWEDYKSVNIQQQLRQLPSIDALLAGMPEEVERWGHTQLTESLRQRISELREEISAGNTPDTAMDSIRQSVVEDLAARSDATLVPVFNLSGTVLHTNLGRANLPTEAIDAIKAVAAGPSNLEFDLASGKRGDRESHIEALICKTFH